jgi:hypothetical protein
MLRTMARAKSQRRSSKAGPQRAAAKAKAGSKAGKPVAGKPKSGKSATKPKTRKQTAAKPTARKGAAIDPRVLAAIGLALADELAVTERAETLAQPLSAWVALGRARAVRTPAR